MDVSGGDEVAQLLATMTQGDEHEGPKDHEAGRLAKSMRAFTHETQAMDLDEEMQGPKQEDEAPQQEDEGPKQEQLGPKQEDEGPKQDENVAALRSWKEDELVAFLRAWKEEWGKKHEDNGEAGVGRCELDETVQQTPQPRREAVDAGGVSGA